MLKQYLSSSLITVIILGVGYAPLVSARHNSWSGGNSYSRQIDKLDDEIVEDLFIPVLFGVTLNQITPDFGDPRGGGTRQHEGQDMMAPLGTPIVSPTKAVVTKIGTGDSAGKYVYTANPGGETFRYMHLDDFANIKAGDLLEAGDYIGTVGDTGNAVSGHWHLHFEIRKGEAFDPYPRITKELSLKEKMQFVVKMFKDLDDEEEMAELLVDNYRSDFVQALNSGYELPDEIEKALKDKGVVNNAKLIDQLNAVIKTIPSVVKSDLTLGASGVEVSLVQTFLIFNKVGPATNALVGAGATGYYGPITAAALSEYQQAKKIPVTGNYDAETRKAMLK